MSESPPKMMKLTETFPEYLLERITSTYLPIKYSLQNRTLSKSFNENPEIRSRDLDFSGIYSRRRYKPQVVKIIEGIFSKHTGSQINRFVLPLKHFGVEDKIVSWINTCISKNIQELVLDFSKSKKLAELPIDLSAIKTLTVLKLKWCKFVIPDDSPSGLKLLKTLSLMRTDVTKEMIDAIFKTCILLESLELIQCPMFGTLSFNAKNHKNFKSLSVCSVPRSYINIILDAPTLEDYTYEGYVTMLDLSKVNALKQAKLQYKRTCGWYNLNPSNMVLANMGTYTQVYVLATTNIFLEALSYIYTDKGMEKPFFWFWNLKQFEIVFKSPTICNLYNIAEFMLQCPNLERVVIDINGFTFEPGMYWNKYQKSKTEKHNYELKTIKYVDINGYKNHSHELDIIEFFVKNAPSLEKLKLIPPTNPKVIFGPRNLARINHIKRISPKKGLVQIVRNHANP